MDNCASLVNQAILNERSKYANADTIDNLQSQLNDANSKLDSLRNDYNNLNATYTSLNTTYSELQGNFTSLQSNFTSLEGNYTTLNTQFNTYNSTLVSVLNRIEEHNGTIFTILDNAKLSDDAGDKDAHLYQIGNETIAVGDDITQLVGNNTEIDVDATGV